LLQQQAAAARGGDAAFVSAKLKQYCDRSFVLVFCASNQRAQ
jgi:hypothetical protein